MAQAKGEQQAVHGDGGDGDEKGVGRGLASLGDLPSLGRKLVSQRAVSTRVDLAGQEEATSPAK